MLTDRLCRSAGHIEQVFTDLGFAYCFIGGIAVQRWGEPRNTNYLDVTLLTGFGDESPYIDALLQRLSSRIEGAKNFALQSRTLLLEDEFGTPIDVSLGAMPFEERSIARASKFSLSHDIKITTCRANDLVVHKAFANRDRDWTDIRGIFVRSFDFVDLDEILEELEPLAEIKNSSECIANLKNMAQQFM